MSVHLRHGCPHYRNRRVQPIPLAKSSREGCQACLASQSGLSDKRNRREMLVAQRATMPLRGVSNKTCLDPPPPRIYCLHACSLALDDPPLFPRRRPIRPSMPRSRRWQPVVVVALATRNTFRCWLGNRVRELYIPVVEALKACFDFGSNSRLVSTL